MSESPKASPVLVVMGVSGCGKTTAGRRLAAALGCEFAEGDDWHPPANVAKMRAGTPLTDAERWPWLRELAGWIAERVPSGAGGVVACSALKRTYRDLLAGGSADVFFVHLAASREVLARRLAGREHPYMPADLLDSQLATLEPLQPDELGVTVDVAKAPDDVLVDVLAALDQPTGQDRRSGPPFPSG